APAAAPGCRIGLSDRAVGSGCRIGLSDRAVGWCQAPSDRLASDRAEPGRQFVALGLEVLELHAAALVAGVQVGEGGKDRRLLVGRDRRRGVAGRLAPLDLAGELRRGALAPLLLPLLL